MVLRHRLRLPLWAAVAIPAAAYLLRAVAWGTLAPQLPQDAIVFGALAIVLVLAATMGTTAYRRRSDSDNELKQHDDHEGDPREHDEV